MPEVWAGIWAKRALAFFSARVLALWILYRWSDSRWRQQMPRPDRMRVIAEMESDRSGEIKPQRFSLSAMMIATAFPCACLASVKVAPRLTVAIVCVATPIVVILRYRSSPFIGAALLVVATVLTVVLTVGIATMFSAFAPPPPGTVWLGGGGWSTVYYTAILSALLGLMIAVPISIVWLTIATVFQFINSSADRSS